MADENENTQASEEISSKPDYTPIRINQLARAERYEGDDMILLARPRSSTAYTTVRQTVSDLTAQVYEDVMAYAAETSSIISSRTQLEEKGQHGQLGQIQLVGATTIYDIDRDVQDLVSSSVKTLGDQAIGGDKTFETSPRLGNQVSISSVQDNQFVTYGQVKEYAVQSFPTNGVVYAPETRRYVISSFTSKGGNNPKQLPETFVYRVQRDCELHISLESVATSKVQPSPMSIWIQTGDDTGTRQQVYRFPDNDKEAYIACYWAHAIKKDMRVVLLHKNAQGNGWYLRYIAEVC